MNKNFVVVDLYEGVDVVAECDTLAQVFARIAEREADTDGECPIDSFITILITEIPSFRIDTAAHVCQETGTMTLEYEQIAGMANTFRITFSPDMAFYMGRMDTVGTITTPGQILMTNMPSIGVGDCYLNIYVIVHRANCK